MRRLLLLLCVPFLAHCGDGPVPIPDHFKAAFATGRICVPSQNGNPTVGTTFPIRLELCRYRCITLDPGTVTLHDPWRCVGSACQMAMLVTAGASRVTTEPDCDGRDLENPPTSECVPETYTFAAEVPKADGMPLSGIFQVTVPYLTLEQADRVLNRLSDPNADTLEVLTQEVGVQNYPNRQFTLQFDPSAAVSTAATEADCKSITLP